MICLSVMSRSFRSVVGDRSFGPVATLASPHGPGQPIDRLSIQAWHKVPVDVNGDFDRAVAHLLFDAGRALPASSHADAKRWRKACGG